MRIGRSVSTRLVVALLAAVVALSLLPALASPAKATPDKGTAVDVCGTPAPGTAACLSKVRTDDNAKQAKPSKKASASPDVLGNSGGYDPAYLQSAYNLASLTGTRGAGRTVAIVDAYDAPNAEADLGYY